MKKNLDLETIKFVNERWRAKSDFYGTGIEIWAGFGPVWLLLRPVFSCNHGQENFLKTL